IAHHWRRRKRQYPLDPELAETAHLHDALTFSGAAGPDPARQAERNDTLAHLYDRLEERDRRVVELRLQGYSTAEVARHLGLDAGVLGVRLSRLRRWLREEGAFREWF